MNDRALSGVLMLALAGGIAWAWLTGRLDSTIDKIVSASGGGKPAAHPATPGSSGQSGIGGAGSAGGGAAGGGGGSW